MIQGISRSLWSRVSAPVLLGWMLLAPAEPRADGFEPFIDFSGLADVRFFATDDEVSNIDAGFGKVRFGGSNESARRQRVNVGDIAASAFAQITPSLSLFATGQFNPDQEPGVDILEGFFRYRPVSTGRFRFSLKGGALIPPVSSENRGTAWTNLYTITNSAANTWIAEEVRPVGPEVDVEYRGDDLNIRAGVGSFFSNDRSGLALAIRGFTFSDGRVGLFGEVPLTDATPGDDAENDPFLEEDGRAGFSGFLELRHEDYGEITFYAFDNRGDPTVAAGPFTVWNTEFYNITASTTLPGDVFLTSQVLFGEAFTSPAGAGSRLGTDFITASALVAREFSAFRDDDSIQVALRGEYFKQQDESTVATTPLDERGFAFTTGVSYRIAGHHRVTFEHLFVSSDRTAGPGGAPISQNESLFQLSYRLLF